MLKSKILKVLAFASAMIITSSCFIFTSSAELVLDGFQYNAQGLSFNDITIYLVDSQGNQTELTTANAPINVANGIACWVDVPDKLVYGTWYDLVIELHADSYIADPDLYTLVQYRSTVDVTKFDCIGVGDCYRWGTGGLGPDQKATTQAWSNNYTTGYIITYPANGPKTVYEYYHSSIRIRPKQTFTGLTVYIQDVTVKTYTEEEKNTENILNGGHDSPSYSAPDDTSVNEYHDLETSINDSTADSRSDSISIFNNFGNFLQQSRLAVGLVALSKVFTDFFSIDWLATIIQFALSLGAFSFILGASTLVIGRLTSRSDISSSRRKK